MSWVNSGGSPRIIECLVREPPTLSYSQAGQGGWQQSLLGWLASHHIDLEKSYGTGPQSCGIHTSPLGRQQPILMKQCGSEKSQTKEKNWGGGKAIEKGSTGPQRHQSDSPRGHRLITLCDLREQPSLWWGNNICLPTASFSHMIQPSTELPPVVPTN